MAEDGRKLGGLSSGLAVVLKGEDKRDGSQRSRLVSYCDDFGEQSVERTLEHIFDLPYKTINSLTCPVNAGVVRSIIKNQFSKYHVNSGNSVNLNRDGVSTSDDGSGSHDVRIEESSICGDIRFTKQPLVLEGHSVFSSVRCDACVWKGKWMYEVTLETAGIQQIGWATLSCPFTDQLGVGDGEDSYAYDGKRVRKWNKEDERYGQPWVVGDVIGCCIDLDSDEIGFWRNGISLGVAFRGIRKMVPGLGYYPAISLSQGERCELNFGTFPFRYPVDGFLPVQSPPNVAAYSLNLLRCLSRLLEMQHGEKAGLGSVEKLRSLKRFVSFKELFRPVSRGICEELFCILSAQMGSAAYVARGPLLSFIVEVFKVHAPHNYRNLDTVLDCFLEIPESRLVFEHLISALSSACKTASWVLPEFPYSGPYIYLSLACHILRREELMILWWSSPDFEFVFEGFLSWRSPNKQDLQTLIPSVWWPGSSEDMSSETSMLLTTSALSEAINMVEEKHRELCCLVMKFIPPSTPPQQPGSVFKTFLQNLLLKNRGADRNLPPPGVSSNSVLVSLYTVILHFLSERSTMRSICGWMKNSRTDCQDVGFLHRGGEQSFSVGLFLRNDPQRVDFTRLGGSYSHLANSYPTSREQEEQVIRWEEGCMDDEETKATHFGRQQPCCCSNDDVDFAKISKHPIRYMAKGVRGHCNSIQERPAHGAECSAENLNDEIEDKAGTSDQSETQFDYRPVQPMRTVHRENNISPATLKEEELLDAMLLLYHLGVAPNFKQASYYISRQSHWISLLEETDKHIKERACGEEAKSLKEARSDYREKVIDCVRQCTWYRISLFSRWKQKGMYATCMWIVQLLLTLSKFDSIFIYVPEYYLETLVDSFHVLRKSDPPFVPSAIFMKQGLASFVTFVVMHFNDPRISSADLKDLLLQSISVLVQYREFLAVFERNEAATRIMPKALLSAFDNRSWVPVTNILVRLCKGSGFGASKRGESTSSSIIFSKLLREACMHDGELFLAFLNRLFNTLSWSMTELSISIREMQEIYQHSFEVMEYQQKKCSVIFDLSCNLARVVEFCTHDMPQAFLLGEDTNLRRLAELIVFIISQLTSTANPELLDMFIRRPGQSLDKANRGMILAPLAGMILNLLDAGKDVGCGDYNDIIHVLANMGCAKTVRGGFDLLEDNWVSNFSCALFKESFPFVLFSSG
ncbi:OLC1v1009054C5 [Oldenlandia corymbosa var. corymbosa]|uniref:RING-type E3 ubiquitin transferase n=1 Tax=Oldenlandia corymbosa var. corymbosa TaxID=529605 RepID=A0AAV1DR75_OLDCO|nr:OLC1v1009054C5 [Oldenlandia corymbosa var. corymbosa]